MRQELTTTDSLKLLMSPSKARFRFYGGLQNYRSVVKDALTGSITAGDDCSVLEKNVAATIGVDHGLCLPQARVGIYLALRALLRHKKKVILSPYTIHDVVNMVICAGGQPVFADIVRETCNIDARQVEALLDDETGAVLVTHLHGLACDVETIAERCRHRGVPLLEDCAQAFGCRVDGRPVGSFGTVGIYSFGQAKNVNCYYGGMLVTSDDKLAETLRHEMEGFPYQSPQLLFSRIANCFVGDVLMTPVVFKSVTNFVFRYGYLHDIEAITSRVRGEDEPAVKRTLPETYLRRMTPMQARLVNAALPTVDDDTRARIAHAEIYHRGLSDLGQLILPPLRTDGSHIYLTFPIQVRDRHDLVRYLARHGRDITVQHIGNNADYECFAEFARDCPNARATADEVVLLPTYPSYGRAEVETNISLIHSYFASK